MGACTFANRKEDVVDNKRVVQADVTFSATYTTLSGGDSVAPNLLGLKQVDRIQLDSHQVDDPSVVTGTASTQAGKTAKLNLATGGPSAPRLRLYETANTEVADASYVGVTLRITFYGS